MLLKMVDNKSKTSLIRHTQKNITLMKINNIILVLGTHIILLSSFVIYFYLRQGGYVFAWVCLWVCEFVCEQDNSKTYGWIVMKFSGYV